MNVNSFKKLALFLLTSTFCASLQAQDCLTENGYIYSEEGFAILSGEVGRFEHSGLYTADGKMLLHANRVGNGEFYVLYGTEIIGKKAFAALGQKYSGSTEGNYCVIYLPSTVKYIHPQAFDAQGYNGGNVQFFIQTSDECVRSNNRVKESSNATTRSYSEEVARYNMSGSLLPAPQQGINVIQMSDNTSRKELVK